MFFMKNMKKKTISTVVAVVIMATVALGATLVAEGGILNSISVKADVPNGDDGGG
jgi:hypothetical protein